MGEDGCRRERDRREFSRKRVRGAVRAERARGRCWRVRVRVKEKRTSERRIHGENTVRTLLIPGRRTDEVKER